MSDDEEKTREEKFCSSNMLVMDRKRERCTVVQISNMYSKRTMLEFQGSSARMSLLRQLRAKTKQASVSGWSRKAWLASDAKHRLKGSATQKVRLLGFKRWRDLGEGGVL